MFERPKASSYGCRQPAGPTSSEWDTPWGQGSAYGVLSP